MLKLKCQQFGHLMRRADSLEKTLMLGKIESKRRRGWISWEVCMQVKKQQLELDMEQQTGSKSGKE